MKGEETVAQLVLPRKDTRYIPARSRPGRILYSKGRPASSRRLPWEPGQTSKKRCSSCSPALSADRPRNILPSLGQAQRPRPFITLSPPCPRLARGFYEQIKLSGPSAEGWTGTAATWCLGACPTPWTPTSVSRHLRRRWANERRRSSIPAKGAGSPAKPLAGS